ncbi:unnamed protein product, partial [Rotaria magnacalcarata]
VAASLINFIIFAMPDRKQYKWAKYH